MNIDLELYFATNRRHTGNDQWRPTGYSHEFSTDSSQNLRFGKVTITADLSQVNKFINSKIDSDTVDGVGLSGYLEECVRRRATDYASGEADKYIEAFRESLDPDMQPVRGSSAFFDELHHIMSDGTDVMIFVHGFNTTWEEAVSSALALELSVTSRRQADLPVKKLRVVLFTWASDGKLLLYTPYLDDRHTAEQSGKAFARGMLFLRDALVKIRQNEVRARFKDRADIDSQPPTLTRNASSTDIITSINDGTARFCDSKIHLTCHSMGNYVLEHAMKYIETQAVGRYDRMFEQVFLCSADIGADALEKDEPLGRLNEMCATVNVYFNAQDKALYVSEYTKRFADRLGNVGPLHPELSSIGMKVHSIDCTAIVKSTVSEHSYFLNGLTNLDLCASLAGMPQSQRQQWRVGDARYDNVWKLVANQPKDERDHAQ